MPGRRLTRREGRALLVGESPCRGARPGGRALDGPAGDRLASYLGALPGYIHCDRHALLEEFDTVNLLGRWPGSQGKGAAWSPTKARRAAGRLPLRGVVVLLGQRVANAYQLGGLCWAHWLHTPAGAWVTAIPHPSGVNRLYNDEAMRALVAEVLHGARVAARDARPPALVRRK